MIAKVPLKKSTSGENEKPDRGHLVPCAAVNEDEAALGKRKLRLVSCKPAMGGWMATGRGIGNYR